MIRPIARLSAPQHLLRAGQRHQRRWASITPPTKRPRSFKNSLLRWGLAGGGVYAYANSDLHLFDQAAHEDGVVGTEIYDVPQEARLPTLETVAESRRQRQAATASAASASSHTDVTTAPSQPQLQQLYQDAAPSPTSPNSSVPPIAPSSDAGQSFPGALEEEAEGEGAFNEETGEINWDCPCLGGMAHGPCGDQFRSAFSCFVYSKEEPKGVDCIDKFKTMQDCFREHPDVYGAELTEDLDEETEAALDEANAPSAAAAPPPDAPYSGSKPISENTPAHNLTAQPPSTPTSASSSPSSPTSATPPAAAATLGSKAGETLPSDASTGGEKSGTKVNDVDGPSGVSAEEPNRTQRAKEASKQVKEDHDSQKSEQERSESSSAMPKAAHDTTSMNEGR